MQATPCTLDLKILSDPPTFALALRATRLAFEFERGCSKMNSSPQEIA